MQKQKITFSLIIIILSILLSFQLKAQVYPIQVNTQLIPPYSLRLSDYVSPGTNRVSVNMMLTDINKPECYTRLELLIEGAGITIRTSPTFNPGPIILQGGIPEFLTSSDLYEWFQPQNLDFSGYSKSDYLATGRLPEGVYRISFIAYDIYKRTRVSNNTAITTWLLLNDPPIINLPFPDYKVEHIDPQNIVFQWTPRHTGSPNSAFTTEYEFTMVEIWPEGRDPNNAMQTSFPIFQTTTTNTNLVYGLAEPFLEPGRQYAYQIQARDMDGRDMFKNNGYSEVRMFTFGEACKPITNIEAKAEKYFEAEISWTPGFNQTAFSVRYRKANYPDAEWFEKDSYLDHIKLSNLEELTTYEYQIMAYCGTYESDYSEIQTFTTPAPKVSSFECGAGEEISPITNHDPLPTLNEGDYIWSGSFMFEIKEATGSNGIFSGKAFAMIPYLGYIKLLAEFKNIKINTDNRVYEGEIKSVYNPDSPFVLGLDTDNDDDDNNGDNDNTTDGDESEISDTTFTSDIDSIYIEDDVIIIVTEDGTDTIHTTDDIIITDEDGDTWIVDGGEVVTGGGGTGPGGGGDPTGDGTTPAVSSTDEIKIKAEFIQNENQYYGFDKLKYDVHKPQYEQVSIYDKQEYVPWKSISSFGSDKVLVKISDSDASFTVDHVKYRTSSGIEITPFTYQGQEDTRMLMLNGKADTETEGIEAYITYKNANDTTENEKEVVIGKLNTLSLDKLKINLVIVPVNASAGFSATEFTNALNEIYQQSVVEWNVTVENVYNINQDDWDKDEDGKMNDGESTLLSNYSDEQIKLKRQYKSDRDMDNDAYYVFVMSNIPSKTGLAGYMPLKGQYAFIHSANSINAAQDDLSAARLIAHELGHGAFRLWHTFSSESDYYMVEKSSENLMDYNNGEELHKYQWNKIHNPDGGFYMFQDEEEGAALMRLKIKEGIGKKIDIENIEKNYCFLTPSLKPIKIPEAEEVYFESDGSLYAFKVNGVSYNAVVSDYGNKFYLYADKLFFEQIKDAENLYSTNEIPDDKKYNNYELAKSGDKVAVFKDYTQFNNDCQKIIYWENTTEFSDKDLLGVVKEVEIPSDATEMFSSNECEIFSIAEQNGIKEGIGLDFYIIFYGSCIDEAEKEELKEYCNLLTEEANDICEAYNISKYRITEEFGSKLQEEGINSLKKYNETFYSGFVKGFYVASKKDLWIYLTDDYNRSNQYEYSIQELRVRYDYIEYGSSSAIALLKAEEEGIPQPLTMSTFTDKYGQASSLVAFILFFELESELIELDFAVQFANRASSVFKKTKTKAFDLDAARNRNTLRENKIKELETSVAAVGGNVTKYPVDGFREIAESWTDVKKARFNTADDFYKKFKPSSMAEDISKIDDELRGIDFDDIVTTGVANKDDIIYSWVYPKRGTEDVFDASKVGQYFTYDKNLNPDVLGIPSEGRILRKFKINESMEYLKSTASDIQWRGNDDIFTGGGTQFYIPEAAGMKNLILIE